MAQVLQLPSKTAAPMIALFLSALQNAEPQPPEQASAGSEAPQRALQVLVVPDNYTQDEQSRFARDAERLKDSFLSSRLFLHAPFRTVLLTKSPSRLLEAEAIGEPAASLFGISFLRPDQPVLGFDLDRLHQYLAATCGYDILILLVNESERPGGGYHIASKGDAAILVLAVTSADARAGLHELGHALGLGDEYQAARWDKSATYPNSFWYEGASQHEDVPFIRPPWGHFLQLEGAYESSWFYYERLEDGGAVIRPWRICIMRSLPDGDFCPVCTEAASMKLYDMIDTPWNDVDFHRLWPLSLWTQE